MSTDGMIDVEVPTLGTVVVQDGNVYEVQEMPEKYVLCWCKSGSHREAFYSDTRDSVSWADQPHPVGVQEFVLTWEVKKK